MTVKHELPTPQQIDSWLLSNGLTVEREFGDSTGWENLGGFITHSPQDETEHDYESRVCKTVFDLVSHGYGTYDHILNGMLAERVAHETPTYGQITAWLKEQGLTSSTGNAWVNMSGYTIYLAEEDVDDASSLSVFMNHLIVSGYGCYDRILKGMLSQEVAEKQGDERDWL